MGPTERVVMQFFILILCIINGLHSYPRHRPSLGILNELIDQDSKSPLIVVVDSNNQATTLDDDQDLRQEQRKDRHVHNPSHSDKFSGREYEKALFDLLRTSERMLEEEYARSRSSNKNKDLPAKAKKNKGKAKNIGLGKTKDKKIVKDDRCAVNEEKKNDSCEATEFLAEQCSQSERSCDESKNC